MKAKQKIRALRNLAIAGSLSALVVPAAAVARPATEIPVRAENSVGTQHQQQPYQLPANFRTEVHSVAQPYSLPSGFHTETQSQSRPTPQAYSPPAGFKPEVQTPSSPTVASNPGSVVREIRTVTNNGSQTLAIVLASIAMALALCAMAYAWFRLTRMQRDLPSRPLVG